MPAGTPSERLAVLRSRVETDTVQPSDHSEALALCAALLESNEALSSRAKESDGWRDLLSSNIVALNANDSALAGNGEHLTELQHIKTRDLASRERLSNALDRATSSRWFWPAVILCILLLGGIVGVFTFDRIAIRIPGITAPAELTETLPALPTSNHGGQGDDG